MCFLSEVDPTRYAVEGSDPLVDSLVHVAVAR